MRKILAILLITGILIPLVRAQGTLKSIDIDVYDGGYVRVTEVFLPPNFTAIVEIPLLTDDVAIIEVKNPEGEPLPFEQNGSVVVVYLTENLSPINVTYFTAALTFKRGDVWTLNFESPVPVKINFPPDAVIVDLSDVPLSISRNSITMPPGNQSVSYTLPPPVETGTESASTSSTMVTNTVQRTTSSTERTSINASSPQSETKKNDEGGSIFWPVGALIAVSLIGGVSYYLAKGRRERVMPVGEREYLERLQSLDLKEEEIEALLYIYRRGGRAKQADVRNALGLPKTTAWRMFKRLEERGLVRVYKKGKENWVELKL